VGAGLAGERVARPEGLEVAEDLRAWSGGTRRDRRWRRRLCLALASAAVAFFTATCVLFVWPATDQPRHVDGILSLNGTDEAAREAEAIFLAEEGYAPVLLFSKGPDACPTVPHVKVVCFLPVPARTVTEARFAAHYAKEHGWHSIMIVPSRAQVTRARLLVKRCFSGQVVVVPASFQLLHFPFEVLYEWAALVKALTVDTRC
jgi:uncharacterized SAM-binding protein YcdF (DUF218 family)